MRFSVKSIRLMVCALIGTGVLFFWTTPVTAQCYDLTLPGPVLVDNTSGHANTGLSLIPNADLSLKSFTFNNQGLADTVYLERVSDGAVLYSKATPAGSPTYVVNVDWDLLEGETYRLLATTATNGRWVAFSGFPYSNTNLMVEGTWAAGELKTSWWFHFTSLRTDCSVCTPSAIVAPTLTTNVQGWPNSGLSFTSTANTTLRSFRFNNQGTHDTVQLIREADGAVLYQATTPDGENDYVAVVDWGLLAGETYHLVSVDASNGRYVSHSAWPVVNGDLIVNGTWGGSSLETGYWFTFSDLKTHCGPCPFDKVRGVTFTDVVAGWAESGLSITADVDTTLRRFTFNNQGAADTVQLVRESDSAIIGSVATPAAETAYEAVVNWPMAEGVTYHLISVDPSNGRWTSYSSWPVSNSMITVNGTWGGSALTTIFWFTFSDLLMTSNCSLFDCDFETADLVKWTATPGAACGGWEWNGACWYTAPALNMSCNEVCSTNGGFDLTGSTHTGNRVGIHFWQEKVFGTDWKEVECSSTDNNTNWGANGGTPDGNFLNPACYVNCACNN